MRSFLLAVLVLCSIVSGVAEKKSAPSYSYSYTQDEEEQPAFTNVKKPVRGLKARYSSRSSYSSYKPSSSYKYKSSYSAPKTYKMTYTTTKSKTTYTNSYWSASAGRTY